MDATTGVAIDTSPPPEPEPDTGTTPIPAGLTYYHDVKPIVDAVCVRCHAEGGIKASTPLDSFENVRDLRMLIKKQVTERAMPPWKAGQGCTEYADDEALTESQIATLAEWADSEGTAGDPANVGPAPAYHVRQLSRVDVKIEMPVEYTASEKDDYRCFLVDWPATSTTYVTGFGAQPGNPEVVHHVIAYLVPPSLTKTFDGYDTADDGPGYRCWGGPLGKGSANDQPEAFTKLRWLGGWAPGGTGGDFPEGTGIKAQPGSKVALQVHYNTSDVGAQPDRTSVVFKTDDTVEFEAWMLPWADPQWLGGSMAIPAGNEDVVHSWSLDPSIALPYLGFGTGNLRVWSASLHMHTLGKSATAFIQRKGSDEEECLLDIPAWDFGWQRSYPLASPRDMVPGDRLGIECHWDNSPGNQALVDGKLEVPKDVGWGEGTGDEMCLGVFYVTLKK